MRSRRPRTAIVFIAMGAVLLVAIVIGRNVGDNVMFLATERRAILPEIEVTPAPEASDDAARPRDWRRLDVVSVATDPAFPDPRVTPPPTPPPPTPTPTRSPPPSSPAPSPTPAGIYTPPPLPLPLVSHEPGESPEPGTSP